MSEFTGRRHRLNIPTFSASDDPAELNLFRERNRLAMATDRDGSPVLYTASHYAGKYAEGDRRRTWKTFGKNKAKAEAYFRRMEALGLNPRACKNHYWGTLG